MRTGLAAMVLVLVAASVADAQPRGTYRRRPTSPVTAPDNFEISHVIYLNNCQTNDGCLIRPGPDDSRADQSSIPTYLSHVTPFTGNAEAWQEIVDCVRQVYAPFDVQVVTERPNGEFHMAIVAGRPEQLQLASTAGGISPFTCGYIPHSISFAFADVYQNNVDQVCWVVAQETAHAWGLDHKFDNRDPMTYLGTGPWRKTFQHEVGSCGEYTARDCHCDYPSTGKRMDAYDRVMSTFGPAKPPPPDVALSTPPDGATVDPLFAIQADASAANGGPVARTELRIDGQLVSTLAQAPWVWLASPALGQGLHAIEITAYDAAGTPGKKTVHVTLGTACAAAADCPTASPQTCVDGRCVAADVNQGGLGASCETDGECASNRCALDSVGRRFCVEGCDPSLSGCPGGFACNAVLGDVCWPADALTTPRSDGCAAGGGDVGSGPMLSILLALGAVVRALFARPAR